MIDGAHNNMPPAKLNIAMGSGNSVAVKGMVITGPNRAPNSALFRVLMLSGSSKSMALGS